MNRISLVGDIIPICERLFSIDQIEYRLSISAVTVSGKSALFLDHAIRNEKNIIYASLNDGSLLKSVDNCTTWEVLACFRGRNFALGFSTSRGNIILWDKVNREILCLTEAGEVYSQTPAYYSWHGSCGISQCGDTIIYSEYGSNEAKYCSVFRTVDEGITWQKVMTKQALSSHEAEVRHFHTAIADPFFPGSWYVSSGDSEELCRVWGSDDDGITWIEVTDKDPKGTTTQRVHRYTAILFTKESIYWATDDFLDTRTAHLVEASRGHPLRVQVVSPLGSDLARSMVSTGFGFLILSQAKFGQDQIYMQAVDFNGIVSEIAPIPSLRKNSFTTSISSRKENNGFFFSASRRNLTDKSRFTSFRLERVF